jgi:hypothetical protein
MAIWNILRPSGVLYGHSGNFVIIWYILAILVQRTKKNLATPHQRLDSRNEKWAKLQLSEFSFFASFEKMT